MGPTVGDFLDGLAGFLKSQKLFLGGGFKDFWNFHPENRGFMIQFDEHIFQMGGSTNN